MKIKTVTLDVRLSENTKRAIRWVLLPIAVLAGSMAVARAYTTTWIMSGQPVSSSNLKGNLDEIQTRLAGLEGAAPVVIQSAERTGVVAPNTTAWTTVPGLTIALHLTQASSVQMTGNGVQRTLDSNASTICGASYRYTVDGVGRGDAMYGQRINWSTGITVHSTWSIIDFVTLAAGDHTITLQVRLPAAGQGSCYICGEANGAPLSYDSCTLNVMAVP
jgi:hypothetical protein